MCTACYKPWTSSKACPCINRPTEGDLRLSIIGQGCYSLTSVVEFEGAEVIKSTQYIQGTCAKFFAVHILKFEIYSKHIKNKTKNIKMLDLLVKN